MKDICEARIGSGETEGDLKKRLSHCRIWLAYVAIELNAHCCFARGDIRRRRDCVFIEIAARRQVLALTARAIE